VVRCCELAEQPSGASVTRILYLITDEISSMLLRGQLAYLVGEGFDIEVGTHLADPQCPKEGVWDDGVTVRHVPFVREPSPVRDVRALLAAVLLIRRTRPDIVNSSTPKAGLVGTIAAWLCRVPVRVYVVRGFRFETAAGARRRLFVMLETMAARCATHVVFNSASLRQVAENEGVVPPGRGQLIAGGSGNGIDVERFAADKLPSRAQARSRLGVPTECRCVGFVGRLTRDKGVADLLDAVAKLRADRPDVHLLLVGDFEEGDPVDAHTRRTIEAAPWVTRVPWLDDTRPAYRAMDVLAFPSAREGLPNVPLEAQLCGVPVVGYAATGTIDAVRDDETGVLVDVGDRSSFEAELAELLDDSVRRQALSDAGPTWVAGEFDQRRLWSAWSEQYVSWLLEPSVRWRARRSTHPLGPHDR
jgi:Glycosyltransferase